eukprot:TRINITY_DN14250_c0_g1_i2.p2 TRINITY_DN14250_c0_g1~~TRINITY_DN14250_c0_g1_i2.p2  ORF type:complete len:131 (-),score=1.64 TRINITY_DN14250_c0_g1_i2:129-521(-)
MSRPALQSILCRLGGRFRPCLDTHSVSRGCKPILQECEEADLPQGSDIERLHARDAARCISYMRYQTHMNRDRTMPSRQQAVPPQSSKIITSARGYSHTLAANVRSKCGAIEKDQTSMQIRSTAATHPDW